MSLLPSVSLALALALALSRAQAAASAAPSALPELNLERDCGGVGDGKTYNDAAWAACLGRVAAAGGGLVYVPAGAFLSGPFNISTNGTTIVLGANSSLVASPETSRFPFIAPLPSLGMCREYMTRARYSAFITLWNASDVRITGNASGDDRSSWGLLNGNGPTWWALRESKVLQNDPGGVIETMYSERVEIDHVRVLFSPYWHIHPFASSFVHIHDADVSSLHQGPETDGIDPDSSHDVLIERVNIDTGDDAIAIKSGWDQVGIDFGMPSYNILVRDSTLSTGANGFCIGSEMSGGVYNATALNVTCLDVDVCFRLKSALGRGGVVRDIAMINSTIIGAKTAVEASNFYGGHPGPVNASLIPIVGNALVDGLVGVLVEAAGAFAGLNVSNISAMTLRNIRLDAPAGSWSCSFVSGTAHNVAPAPCAEFVNE